MKLGFNATHLNDRPSGMGVFTYETARGLSRLHDDLRIFIPGKGDGLPPQLLFRVPRVVRGSRKLMNNLLRAVYLNSLLPLHAAVGRLDVLYCPMLEYPFIGRIPLVVTVHDLHPIIYPEQFGFSAPYFRVSLRMLKKRARRVTVVSAFIKNELLAVTDLPEEIVDVIPNGYNRDLFRPQDPSSRVAFLRKFGIGGRYILFVGNLFPYKNVRLLIDAFLRIEDKTDHHLVIVGRKEFAGGTLRDHEKIHYIGYAPHEELPLFYSHADFLVHPSLSEGFGFTPLEAMACGTPVLSSNAASLPEVVGDAGILFDPADCGALSSLILEMAEDSLLRDRLRERGYKQAAKFSWERTASSILASCERATGR
ncbi:MAG: glycosyltransferase family 1 protein [Nitrospiraceae bacterium]|nr:glycosyltransferase family 1 protein [Nitrospiraceae bacterium]